MLESDRVGLQGRRVGERTAAVTDLSFSVVRYPKHDNSRFHKNFRKYCSIV